MPDTEAEQLGPIDWIVVEFPAETRRFDGSMARELRRLVDAGLIRILDLLVVDKLPDGEIEVYEIEDLDDLGDLAVVEAGLAEILAMDDVGHVAAALEPGSAAGVVVWENTWAAPFGIAARESGGQLVASGRIPTQALLAALAAGDSPEGD